MDSPAGFSWAKVVVGGFGVMGALAVAAHGYKKVMKNHHHRASTKCGADCDDYATCTKHTSPAIANIEQVDAEQQKKGLEEKEKEKEERRSAMDAVREWTTFLQAIAGGDVEQVGRLLPRYAGSLVQMHKKVSSSSSSSTSFNLSGKSPMYIAASHGHQEILRLLLNAHNTHCQERGDLLQSSSSLHPFLRPHTVEGYPLLFAAVEGEQFDLLCWLVEECQVDPNVAAKDGTVVLHLACQCGQEDAVEYLLARGATATLNKNGGPLGITPLFSAVLSRNINLVRHLLEHGASTRTRAKDGGTPVSLAAELELVDIKTLLLHYQAAEELHASDVFSSSGSSSSSPPSSSVEGEE
ncbi:Arf GTPase activating protein [Balamuthia mandrillaris]